MISIIIPVYNVEKYLKRCLDSILNQEGDYPFEVILVNDGSPDKSQKIIDDYARKYPKVIKAFVKENGGLSSARNYGIKKAAGEYILLVDSDDYIEHNLIELVLSEMKKNQSLMGIFDYYLTKQDGTKANKEIYKGNNYYVLGKQAAWARIYHKSLFEENLFPEGINYEDLALVPFLIAKATGKLTYIRKPLYNYIIDNTGSIMNTYNEKIFDIYPAMENLISLFKEAGLYDLHKEEIHYLALEHLCVGHGYRLIRYPKKTWQDFIDITNFMQRHFGNEWQKNKYVEQKIQRQNISSAMALVVPTYLSFLKLIFSNKRGNKR